jgi:hypothetical protein
MSRFLHGLAHAGLILLNVANIALPIIPPPYNLLVSAGLGTIQGVLALKNHPAPAQVK